MYQRQRRVCQVRGLQQCHQIQAWSQHHDRHDDMPELLKSMLEEIKKPLRSVPTSIADEQHQRLYRAFTRLQPESGITGGLAIQRSFNAFLEVSQA